MSLANRPLPAGGNTGEGGEDLALLGGGMGDAALFYFR